MSHVVHRDPALEALREAVRAAERARDAALPAEARVAAALDAVRRRVDRWMAGLLLAHAALAAALAPVRGTWTATAVVATTAVGAFLLAWRLRPGTLGTRMLAGIALQAFCALHIHQLGGLEEMHFFYFTATTAMLFYQDWRALWPGVAALIAQHTLFSWWHNAGVLGDAGPFFASGPVTAGKLAAHYGIALAQAAIAMWGAEALRRRTVQAATAYAALDARQAELANGHAQLEEAHVELESAHDELAQAYLAQQELAAELEQSNEQLQEQAITLEERADQVARGADETARERRRAEAALAALRDGLVTLDPDGRVRLANRRAAELLGVAHDALLAWRAGDATLPSLDAALAVPAARAAAERGLVVAEVVGGWDAVLLVRAYPVGAEIALHLQDVTAERHAEAALRDSEERLQRAQKMEAMGRLAGGIAHDFNNLLMVVGGNLEFVRAELGAGHPSQQDVAEIADAVERARVLVRQLLLYSRHQPVHAGLLDLGAVVRNATRLIARVIGEEIALAVHVPDEALPVIADAGQVEQVLMNLAVNARDAMLGAHGTGGTLTLEVARVAGDAGEPGASDAPAGAGTSAGWIRLQVRDTGCGMDETTRARAFDPFFTTKRVGEGTGLGLATVAGIVQRAGGSVALESAPGEGTLITIHLPVAPDGSAAGTPIAPMRAVAAAPGTVLLVEDEAPVRAALARLLEQRGWTVRPARHGADALLLWAEHGDAVDVVVTDVRMPEMGGPALVARLAALRPTLPVVLLSGYAEHAVCPDAPPYHRFLEKPCSGEALAAAMDAAIAAAREVEAVVVA